MSSCSRIARGTRHSAVRVGLDRDSVVLLLVWGLSHAQLVGAGGGERHPARWQAGTFDRQLEVGDRAVDGVVLGARRVGVDPADEVLGRGGDAAVDDDVLAGEEEAADGWLLFDPGRADRAEAAEPVRLAIE